MPHEFLDLDIEEVSAVDHPANKRKFLIVKRAVAKQGKTEGGQEFLASDYAYVPDREHPSTWKLRMTARPGGAPDARTIGAALAALSPGGFRGRRVEIPTADMPGVKRKLLAAWRKAHPDAGTEEVPQVLKNMYGGAQTTDELLMYHEVMEHWWELWNAFQTSVDSIMCDDNVDRPTLLRQTVEEFAARAQDLLPQMMQESTTKAITEQIVALSQTVQKRFAPKQWQQAWNTLGTVVKQLPLSKEATMPTLDELLKYVPEEIHQALTEKDATIAKLTAELEKAKNPPGEEDIWKGVSPVIKQRMEELEKQTKAAEEAAAFEKAERIKKECMAEASTFKHLTLSPDDHWPLFKAMREMSGETGQKLVEVLRAADEAVRLSKVMQPRGSGSTEVHGSTATAKVAALVKAAQSEQADLSYTDALQKVFREHDGLYEDYKVESTLLISHAREE